MNDFIGELKSSEIFPDSLIKHNTFVSKLDGVYKVSDGLNKKNTVTIKNNRLLKYDCYTEDPDVPYISWSFEYNDDMQVFREFPLNKQPRELFCDKNGVTDKVKEDNKKFDILFNEMLADAYNSSMQLNGKVSHVDQCDGCRNVKIHCKNGDTIYTCDDEKCSV